MKDKIIVLVIMILMMCGCSTEVKSYEVDGANSSHLDIVIDEATCVEYFIYNDYKQGGISVRYNADGTIKLNKDCLEAKDER